MERKRLPASLLNGFRRTALAAAAWTVLLCTVLLVPAAPAVGQDATKDPADRLRDAFAFESLLTFDTYSNVAGGVRTGTETLSNLDVTATVDLEQAAGLKGMTFFVYGMGDSGGSPSEMVGDLQTVSNIDTDENALVYEAWLEQVLFDGRFSWKLGLYDLNSEFDAIDTAGLFINSSHGIGPDFSQTGANGPSIFPVTSLGLRLAYTSRSSFYVQAVALDAVPGDPEHPTGTRVHLRGDEGLLLAAEVGARGESMGWALGAWHYTEPLTEDAAGFAVAPRNNEGFYVFAEAALSHELLAYEEGLRVFGRFGMAESTVNTLDYYAGAGLVYTGPFAGRGEDQLGLAVAYAHASPDFLRSAGGDLSAAETAVELTYRAPLFPWLTLQGDVQYVVHPGLDPSLDDALVVGLRVELSSPVAGP